MDVTTERLRIRDLVLDDLEPMIALWGDPEVDRWMKGYGPRTRQEVERWLPDTIAFNEETPRESHNCAIEVLGSGTVMGWIGFGPSSQWGPGGVNFGWALLPSFRNRGYGTEALEAVIRFCFDSLGVQRFWGETAVGNHGSAQVMEKVGMRRMGVVDGQVQFLIERAP